MGVIQSSHLRKHWNKRIVRCFFNKKVRADKRAKKATASFPRPISKLRPLVFAMTQKYAGKVKFGRGFSLAELKEAKLTPALAQSVGIAVDHRRHNKSADMQDANVKRLTDYKAKLILFPKHEGKLKKGEIPDSTAEKVKKAAQVKTTGVFALPPVDKTTGEKASITKEMKAEKTYLKLRQARVDQRYEGKRIAAAKKAEDAKK